MHRSVTLSEIVSSTFTNNAEDINSSKNRKEKFVTKIGIGLIELLTSSLYQCYGIIFAQLVDGGHYSIEKASWTTFLYIAAWNLTAPWSNFLINQLEQRQCFPYKVIITVCTLLLAAGVVIPPHFIIYGIFGGAFSNIIYTHLRHIARRRYKSTERSFEGNIQSARAISLLVMPHVVLLLIGNYKILYVSMIHAAIILNIIPATLIIRLPKVDPENMPGYSRYQTLPIFSQQMKEMKVFTSSGNTSDIKRSESFSVKEDSSCDETESEEDNDESDDLLMQEENMAFTDRITEGYLPTLTPNTVQLYYSNAGVSILPQIPEEIDEFEETNINVIDPKRLSRISTALEEINRTERRESVKEAVVLTEVVLKPEPINNIEYIPNYKEKQNKFLKDVDSVKKKSCCACSPYTIFLWRRRFRSLKDFFIDFLFNPLFRSLSDLHFYPILFSKVSIAVSYNFFITITPYISLQKNDGYRKEDMAVLLSYIAFSWCLSLVLLPVLIKFSATKLRAAFIVGLTLSSCSMLLLTKRKMSNDFITWSCLLFGFGYGLSRFCENIVYQGFAGKRKYAQLEALLNGFSGIFVILVYYFIYINDCDLVALFPWTAGICYFVNAVLWIIVPIFKIIIIFFRTYFKKRTDSSSIF
ncbi:uncharacterized protein [Diabrotica undecimpunctata]|uniref:uncharacterized protein n=1 Tax=Diabrotica undecimpunctata TaxID=50387 RepID=UPI003B633659